MVTVTGYLSDFIYWLSINQNSKILKTNFRPSEGAMEILTATITQTKPDVQDAKRKLISGYLDCFAVKIFFGMALMPIPLCCGPVLNEDSPA